MFLVYIVVKFNKPARTLILCLFLYVKIVNMLLLIYLCIIIKNFHFCSIGYPVVTLGFGLKSMISHQFRLVSYMKLFFIIIIII